MSGAAGALRRIRPRRSSRSTRRRPIAALALPPRLRSRLVALAVVAVVAAGLYTFVLRDIGLVAVHTVEVTGLTGSRDAAQATTALQKAARQSTTLHVDHGALAAVTTRYPLISSIAVHPDFPNTMRIDVVQQRPAAMLIVGARRIPVAGDGSILTGVPIKGELPTVKVQGAVPDKRLTPSGTLDAVRVAGGAPARLTPTLVSVTRQGEKGWVIKMLDGPDLIFGSASQVALKWRAATRVLADRDAKGADYLDLRIPTRPAAGGLPVQTVQPVAPAGSDATDPEAAAQAQGAAPAAPQATAPQAGPAPPAGGTAPAPIDGTQP